MHFEPAQWALLVLAAVIAGFSKTGLPGAGILFVAIFSNLMPARQATGVVLPMLILGDVLAYFIYRKDLEWRRVGRLLPWAVAGVMLGWVALGRINDVQTARAVGAMILAMLVLHVWRQRGMKSEALARAPAWFAPVIGLGAGVTTMVANAAGPVMTLYLLAMRLTKQEFLGTGAAFFLVINWVKVPFAVQLGLINRSSLTLNLWLAPAVVAGCIAGKFAAARMNQKLFETIVLVLTGVAAVKLLVF